MTRLSGRPLMGVALLVAWSIGCTGSGPCFVGKLYMNAQGRQAGDRDAAILDKLASDFAASGYKADQLLLNLVGSEPFRFVEPTKP